MLTIAAMSEMRMYVRGGKTSTQVFLGSAASKLLRYVPVPVMIVPGRRF